MIWVFLGLFVVKSRKVDCLFFIFGFRDFVLVEGCLEGRLYVVFVGYIIFY